MNSNILNKLLSIGKSWAAAAGASTPDQDVEASRRQSICDTCEHNRANVCMQCGCPLVSKVYSEDYPCPLGKWDKYGFDVPTL